MHERYARHRHARQPPRACEAHETRDRLAAALGVERRAPAARASSRRPATPSRIGRFRKPAARGCSRRSSTSRSPKARSTSPCTRPRTCRRCCRMAVAIAGYLPREDVRDAFISGTGGEILRGLAARRRRRLRLAAAPGAILGACVPTSRSRFCAAMSTRGCKKLENGEVAATLLAVAGLKRLGLSARMSRRSSIRDDFLPAVGQGAIAITTRADDSRDARCAFSDPRRRDGARRSPRNAPSSPCSTARAARRSPDTRSSREKRSRFAASSCGRTDPRALPCRARALSPMRRALGRDAGRELRARLPAGFLAV